MTRELAPGGAGRTAIISSRPHHSLAPGAAGCRAQEEMILETCGPEDERLEQIYERIEELDPATFEVGRLVGGRAYKAACQDDLLAGGRACRRGQTAEAGVRAD